MQHLPLEILGEIASHLKNPEDLSNFVSSFKKVNELKKNEKLMEKVRSERHSYNIKQERKLMEYTKLLVWKKRYQPCKFNF